MTQLTFANITANGSMSNPITQENAILSFSVEYRSGKISYCFLTALIDSIRNTPEPQHISTIRGLLSFSCAMLYSTISLAIQCGVNSCPNISRCSLSASCAKSRPKMSLSPMREKSYATSLLCISETLSTICSA